MRTILISYRERRGGEETAVYAAGENTRSILPAWMLDAGACVEMILGQPRVSLLALERLRSLLSALGFEQDTPANSQREAMREKNKTDNQHSTFPANSVGGSDPSYERRSQGDRVAAGGADARRRRSLRHQGAAR